MEMGFLRVAKRKRTTEVASNSLYSEPSVVEHALSSRAKRHLKFILHSKSTSTSFSFSLAFTRAPHLTFRTRVCSSTSTRRGKTNEEERFIILE